MLGLFVNTLTPNGKHSRQNGESLRQQIQMQLSLKPKNFFRTFHCISEIYMQFWVLKKQDESHSWSISKIIASERGGYLNVEKVLFQATLRQSTC